ncbi:YabP/YqfC family sporulation protein [[Clostridium] cellulosi]|nr:MAG: sporulation protein [[Clostridium] cellulosi]
MARHKIRKRPESEKRKRRSNRAETMAIKAARAVELPIDFVAGMVHLDFSGNREVVVEGCRGVLEYDENIVCIDTGKMKVRFLGRDLAIRNYIDKSITVSGFINSVEFLT